MCIDYKKIKEENIRDYGIKIDKFGPVFWDNLYSDQTTHFIYELLQNAEDAEATEVRFRLFRDHLELEHNGRSFDEADVRAICALAEGTKRDDRTKIGKFGVGFKSVYAHTSTPEIHSGCAHFAIENYVHPCGIEVLTSDLGTLFVFPFNHQERDASTSFDEIGTRLESLGLQTLLFLNSIELVSYEIEGSDYGTYCRDTEQVDSSGFAAYHTLSRQCNSDVVENERWLVFEKVLHRLAGTDEDVEGLSVQIAFLCGNEDPQEIPSVHKLSQSDLCVFFPTEKSTHLGFLLQGPYVTTLARNSIPKDDSFNILLAEETGELVVEALRWLRDRDWLTVDVLETMPLVSWEYNDSLFEPVYERVVAAITGEALIPANKTGYVSGNDGAIAGSGALRDLLNSVQLQQLFNTDRQLVWASPEITSDRTPELYKYLTQSWQIGIEEIDAETFVRRIHRGFLSEQSDEWVRDFYEYASTFNPHSYSHSSPFNILQQKPIIRLEDGSHVKPLDAYLPTDRKSHFPTVKREVCDSNKSLKFLKNLGLKKPDIVDEVIKFVMPKYTEPGEINDTEHQLDIELIVKALGVDSQQRREKLVGELTKTAFLRAKNTLGDCEFRRPNGLYIRNPQLEIYFEGNPDAWFLSDEYKPFLDNLGRLDIQRSVHISQRYSNYLGHVTIMSRHSRHVRGLNGFDPGFKIDGLEFALSHPNIERSRFIWNILLLSNKNCISGKIESSTRQGFTGITRIEEKVSKVGELARNSAWLPDGNGNFVKPSELMLSDLPDDFHKDEELAKALGLLAANVSIQDLIDRDDTSDSDKRKLKLANQLDDEDCKFLEENPGLIREMRKMQEQDVEQQNPGEYPSDLENRFNQPGSSSGTRPRVDGESVESNSEDRRIETEMDIGNPLDADERSEIRASRKWKVRNPKTRRFLYSQYMGKCQICDETFRKRDDDYYFEAVHFLRSTKGSWLDHPRNAICLCANHSKKFQYGELKTLNGSIRDQIRMSEEDRGHDIVVELCGEPQIISFNHIHIGELRALLEVIETDYQ